MRQRWLAVCGLIAPVWFVGLTLLGGALRPGYSHLSDTISELFSPGSPNKPLLDTLHTIYALLLVLFGIGLLRFVRSRQRSKGLGTTGAGFYITMGLLSVASATAFPQDPWGSAPTLRGQMHIYLHGSIGLLTLVAMVLISTWARRVEGASSFRTYTWATIAAVVIATAFYMASLGKPLMGLAERLSGFCGLQWTFVLALWILTRRALADQRVR